MYLLKTPPLIKTIFSDLVWNIETNDKKVFITFDDGPIPELTPWVLDVLQDYGFTATFFCVGDNVKKYPHLHDRILSEGHSVGNHTFNHLNGWNTDNEDYISNVALCDMYVASKLFRPPYGKLKPSQSQVIKQDKTIVMWDVLSGDFDVNISEEKADPAAAVARMHNPAMTAELEVSVGRTRIVAGDYPAAVARMTAALASYGALGCRRRGAPPRCCRTSAVRCSSPTSWTAPRPSTTAATPRRWPPSAPTPPRRSSCAARARPT